MTLKHLQSLCRRWQKLLGLQDWHIEVEVVRRAVLGGAWGMSDIEFNHRRAVIRIADGIDVPEEEQAQWGPEHTLVHELLHIVLAWWQTEGEVEQVMQEQAINALARGLLVLEEGQQ